MSQVPLFALETPSQHPVIALVDSAGAIIDPGGVGGGGVTSVDGDTGAIVLSGEYVDIAGDETITGVKTLTRTAPDLAQTVTAQFTAVPDTGGAQGFILDRSTDTRPLGFVFKTAGVAQNAIAMDAGTSDIILSWSPNTPGDQLRIAEGGFALFSRSVGHPPNTARLRIDAVGADPAAMVDLVYLTGPAAGPATRLLRVSNDTDTLFSVLATGSVGIGTLAPGQLIQAVKSQSATTQFLIQNLTNNAASKVSIRAQSDAKSLFMESFSTTFAAPLGGHSMVYTSSGSDLALGAGNAERMRLDSLGNVVLGTPTALATTATDRFVYKPSMAGTPTGVPTAKTGLVPTVIDTTGLKLWAYIGGTWKSTTFA